MLGSWSNGLYYIDVQNLDHMHGQDAEDYICAASLTSVADGFNLAAEKAYFVSGQFKNIMWDGQQFVAIEIKNVLDGFIKIYSSADGKAWKLDAKVAGYMNMCTNIVKLGNTYYLAVDRRMQYSTDLVNWSEVPLPPCFDRDDQSPLPEKHIS